MKHVIWGALDALKEWRTGGQSYLLLSLYKKTVWKPSLCLSYWQLVSQPYLATKWRLLSDIGQRQELAVDGNCDNRLISDIAPFQRSQLLANGITDIDQEKSLPFGGYWADRLLPDIGNSMANLVFAMEEFTICVALVAAGNDRWCLPGIFSNARNWWQLE